jgi:hypothetical protein
MPIFFFFISFPLSFLVSFSFKVLNLKNSVMVLDAALLLCPFTVASDIFTLKRDTTKMHYNNVGLNVPNNAPMAVYQAALVRH